MSRLLLRLLPGLIVLSMVLVVVPGSSLAQTPFALTNIGQPIDSNDARMVGRGGWGMAVHDSLNPGFLNTASLTALRHVAIRFTAYGERARSKDETGDRSTYRTMVPDIRVGLPLIKGRLAFNTGFEVNRSSEYHTLTEMDWTAYGDSIFGNEQFVREGSIWQVPLGLGLRVFDGLSVGATLGLVNGTIRDQVQNYFIYPSASGIPLYLANGKVQDDVFTGTRTTWSVQIGSENGLSLGASWTPAHNLDVERKTAMGGLAARSYSNWTMEMPDFYRAGFQAKLGGRWRVGGDGTMKKYGDFQGQEDWVADMVDEYSASFGLERAIDFERHGGKNNMPLRLGARYRRWGYQVGGEDVEEKTFSIGTGFPFRRKMGMLDLALSYSIIGDMAKNGMESEVWRMTFSVSGLEKWW